MMADEGDTFEVPTEIDLGENGGILNLDLLDNILVWVQHEEGVWKWLAEDPVNGNNGLDPIRKRYHDSLNRQVSKVKSWLENPDNAGARLAVIDEFQAAYVDADILHSTSAKAAWLNKFRAGGNEIQAAAALSYFVDAEIPWGHRKVFTGAMRAAIFELGIEPSTAGVVGTELSRLSAEYTEQIRQDRSQTNGLKSELKQLVDDNTKLNERAVRATAAAVRRSLEMAEKQRKEVDET